MQDCNIIEDSYQVLSDGIIKSVSRLTTRNISEGFVIYEKIHYNQISA